LLSFRGDFWAFPFVDVLVVVVFIAGPAISPPRTLCGYIYPFFRGDFWAFPFVDVLVVVVFIAGPAISPPRTLCGYIYPFFRDVFCTTRLPW
jgi:hypothetical protein